MGKRINHGATDIGNLVIFIHRTGRQMLWMWEQTPITIDQMELLSGFPAKTSCRRW